MASRALQCVVSLILALLVATSVQQADVFTEGNVTCHTSLTGLGQTAQVTCLYPFDVRNASFRPLSLDVELYRNESMNAEHVLTCQWLPGPTDAPCRTVDGYTLSGTAVDRQLSLNITALSRAHLGRYVCKAMTPSFAPHSPVPCVMALPESADKENSLYAIIGGAVGGVLLIVVVIVVVIVVMRKRRSCSACCRGADRSPQPGDEPGNPKKRRPGLCCAKSSNDEGETTLSLSTEPSANGAARRDEASRGPEVKPLIRAEETEYQRSERERLDREQKEREKRVEEGLKKMEDMRLKREAQLKAKEEEKMKAEEKLKQVIEENRQVRERGYKNLPPLPSLTPIVTVAKPVANVAPLAKISEYDVPRIHKNHKSEETYDIGEYPWEDFPTFLEKPNKKIPAWAQAENLTKAVEKQDQNPPNLDAIFSVVVPPNLNEMFDHKRPRFNVRTSSANWHGPPHKHH